MKRFTLVTTTLILFLGLNFNLQAQSKYLTDEQVQKIEANYEAFETEMNITEAQKKQFDAIQAQYQKDVIKVQKSTDNRYSKIRQIRALTTGKHKSYADVFTAAQRETLAQKGSEADKVKKAQRTKVDDKLDAFMAELDLTADQKDAFKTIQKSYIKDLATLQSGQDSNYKKMQTARKMKADKNRSLKEVFTSDQYDLFLNKQDELNEWMTTNIE